MVSEMVKPVDILTPVVVVVTGFLAIGTTLLIQESGAEWIHSVWVVVGVSVLVDMHSEDSFIVRIRRLTRKISALFVGLCIGVACGVLVRALYSWDSPRWTILLLRLLVECLLLLGCSITAQRTQKVFSSELALVCLSSSLALFCPTSNLAIARVVGILFACAISLIVLVVFWLLSLSPKTILNRQEIELIDAVLTLGTRVIRGADNDKHEVERLSCYTRQLGVERQELEAHLRPLVFECLSLYWSLMSGAVTPFVHQQSLSLFCGSQDQFDRYFRSSLERIEDGLDGVRNDLIALISSRREEGRKVLQERVNEEDSRGLVCRLVHQWIEANLVEGLQGMEFHFAQTNKTSVFISRGQRWNMASYLVNLSTMISSLIAFVQYVLTLHGEQELADKLVDSLNRISSIQKLGSYSDLLDLTIPQNFVSRRASSTAISPIVGRQALVTSQSYDL